MPYLFGGLTLNPDTRRLTRGDDALHLSRKAMDLLILLVEERHRVVPKEEIFDRLWPQTFVVEANLANLIAEIRRAVSDVDHEIIRTVHGTGYSFAAPLQQEESPDRPSPEFLHVLITEDGQLRLNEGENIVGREPAAAVFLPSKSVSRRHALIHVAGQQATLADLDSLHGTFLEETRVSSAVPLPEGATLRFGTVEARYRRYTGSDPTDPLLS